VSADADETDMLNRRELAEGNIEDALVAAQIQEDVKRIIDALPQSQREVLLMRYYRDMSFKEIAEATNVSINTALGAHEICHHEHEAHSPGKQHSADPVTPLAPRRREDR